MRRFAPRPFQWCQDQPWRRQWQHTPVLLPGKIPWMEEPSRLQSMGSLRVGTTEQLHFHFSLSCTGEGNGSPLQCSCLENPRDRGAWWAAVYGVTQSWTQLKRLSSSSSKTSPTQQKYNSSHPWIFKCSNRHVKKSKMGEIMFNGVFYLTQYI